VEILLLFYPPSFFDQLVVHERDLPGGSAETQESDAREHADHFMKIRMNGTCHLRPHAFSSAK
jgi:hypothetical protein